MTRTVEATGRDVAEATTRALAKLGISDREADIEILDRGRKGFLGIFKATPARVAASRRVNMNERAEEIVSDILRLMKLSYQLHTTEEKNTLVINIETAGSDGLLIGKGGQTISSLEYIANRMLQRGSRKTPKVVLDVSGYKRGREDSLKNKALSLAEQAKSAKKPVTMEPLDAADRRIVYAVLKSDPKVEARSVGQGQMKSIVVAPARGGKTGKSGRSGKDGKSGKSGRSGRGGRGSRGGGRRRKKRSGSGGQQQSQQQQR